MGGDDLKSSNPHSPFTCVLLAQHMIIQSVLTHFCGLETTLVATNHSFPVSWSRLPPGPRLPHVSFDAAPSFPSTLPPLSLIILSFLHLSLYIQGALPTFHNTKLHTETLSQWKCTATDSSGTKPRAYQEDRLSLQVSVHKILFVTRSVFSLHQNTALNRVLGLERCPCLMWPSPCSYTRPFSMWKPLALYVKLAGVPPAIIRHTPTITPTPN